ncbi:M48 family metallopeptidase [Rivihabitans pingtungensis]|jgi:predicted metal-dependent hydrolase|uniref:YgjP-like metallopeptidase domain-containing protein n=2 Tax=Rivihabitans pingtungensis TaxID=1054498 RepID=A0A318KW52_9NEIS|nr:SprT family zinc-dependent metalloprotease [Rivihabitans pingtungensis]PXX82050.1 hypothetical protein DFR34_101283 [Rivihabitans pingtungensis]HNX69823.1 SprT family zinc-dependent metalloprotease [Rivihabitans pingtungensis]
MAGARLSSHQLATARGPLDYTLARSARKTIGLRVSPAGVEVRAPLRLPHAEIVALLNQRADWLWKHLDRLSALAPAPQLAALQQLWLLGRPLPIVREAGPPGVSLEPERVCVRGARDDAHAAQLLKQRYQAMARRLFAERLQGFAGRWRTPPSALKLSPARARWGSCTHDGVIRLSWRLLFAPLPVIDYVLAHELAHRIEMNHSSRFWVEVARLCPDWAAQRAWLRQYGQHAPQW